MTGETPWWKGAVIYQIYPRSFMDSNEDGVGDLKGAADMLGYVASLGVDAIWLSPFFASPMKDFGYDVSDYRAVDPLFGDMADFDRFLANAHKLGLKIIIDQVLAHTSDQHAWFSQSRASRAGDKADWYVWADCKPDGTPPNNWLSVFGGPAWTWDSRRGQFYLHKFLPSQPQLNLNLPVVQDAMLAEMRFWLDKGVDGFRLDAANFCCHDEQLRDNPPRDRGSIDAGAGVMASNPYSFQWHEYDKSRPENVTFLSRVRALLDEYDDRMAVAEIGCDHAIARSAEYVGGPDMLHTAYNFSFLGAGYAAALFRNTVEEFLSAPGAGWPSWAFSNHDVQRVASRWGGPAAPPAFAKMAIALLTCLKGTAFLYQGEELGLPEADVPFDKLQDPYGINFWPEFKGRDGCRTPMPWHVGRPNAGFSDGEPWLPVPSEHQSRAVSRQEAQPDSVLNFTRAFLKWRKAHPALSSGEIRFYDMAEPLLVFERKLEGQTIFCCFNLGASEAALPIDPARIGKVLDGHGLAGGIADGKLVLPGHGAAFLAA